MNSEYRVCRVCLEHENNLELAPIFVNDYQLAAQIFLLTGVKTIELTNHNIPALICLNCKKDVTKAMEMRKKCIESQSFFRKCLKEVEPDFWNKEFENNDLLTIKIEPAEYNYQSATENDHDNFSPELLETFVLPPKIEVEDVINESDDKRENNSSPIKLKEKAKKSKRKRSDLQGTTCISCDKTFCSTKTMRLHFRAMHEIIADEDLLQCTYCDRKFKLQYQLTRHIKSIHKEKVKKPEMKSEEDIFKQKLIGEKCSYCNKYFKYRQSLKDHIKIKHEFSDYSERFLCDICGKSFLVKYYLKRHIRTTHLKMYKYNKKKTQSVPCSICGKIVASNSNLAIHERTHRKLKPEEYYYCDLCGNKFKARGEMSSHIKRIHLYNITYPCKLCPNRSFRKLFQLERHVKVVHQNIRDFSCEWCGKGFGDNNRLQAHIRIHTGEQRFHCTWPGCDRKYTHQTDLRRHTWGHTGHRPFKCQVPGCTAGFMKKAELASHENRAHPAKQSTIASSSLAYY